MGYNINELPTGYDCADGVNNPNGTPLPGALSGEPWSITPANGNTLNQFMVNYNGNTYKINSVGTSPYGHIQFIEEAYDSPIFDYAEQSTITHKFLCDYYTGTQLLDGNRRGDIDFDNAGNQTRLLSMNLTVMPKTNRQVCILSTVAEADIWLPPDEFSVEPVELNPALEKHPRYACLSYQTRDWIRSAFISDAMDVRQTYKNQLNALPGSGSSLDNTNNQWAAATELLLKRQKGEDSFYQAGFKVTYSTYNWYPQDISPGGYYDDPSYTVPYQYVTDENGDSIFQNVTLYNENMFPNDGYIESLTPPYGISWLRQQDTLVLNRTWWKLTMVWIGGTLSTWDNELYNPTFQPYQVQPQQGAISAL